MKIRLAVVLILFFLSGATGLIYQIVWMRKLVLFIGVTSKAVGTILAVYMGGLSIGSWLLGRYGDRVKSPFKLYGWLELGIAFCGFTSLALLDLLQAGYVDIARGVTIDPLWLPLVRALCTSLVLLPPTILMGATLPVLLKAVSRSMKSVGRDAGLLYAVNTLGAVAGTACTALFFIKHLGLAHTAYLAATINLLVALIAFCCKEEPLDTPVANTELESSAKGVRLPVVFFAFAASGFLALAYEVVWTRYLIYVVGTNSVYAFSAILSAFLIGICLGSWMAAGYVLGKSAEKLTESLGTILILIGLSALLTIPLMSVLVEQKTGGEGFWASHLVRFSKSLIVLLVPTVLSGSVFTLVAAIVLRSGSSLSHDSGKIYAANTAGAVFGALFASFLVLPWLGLTLGIALLATINVGVGLLTLFSTESARRWSPQYGAIAVAALVCYGLAFSWKSPEKSLLYSDKEELVFYRDGPESSVAVVRRESGHLHLIVDGDTQAGTGTSTALHLSLLGHLPALFHADPKQALVIAFGTGVSAGHVSTHPIDRLDIVELSPDVTKVAGLFADWNRNVLEDPRVRVFHDDGRNFLLRSKDFYDVIVTDPLNPDDAGMTSLYSKEYYELVYSRLKDGGLTSQWLAPQLSWKDLQMFIRTFTEVFPNSSLWYADFTTVIVGIKGDRLPEIDVLRSRFANEEIRETFATVGVDSVEKLLELYIAGPESLADIVGEGPVNTDNLPLLEYIFQDGENTDGPDILLKQRNDKIEEWLTGLP